MMPTLGNRPIIKGELIESLNPFSKTLDADQSELWQAYRDFYKLEQTVDGKTFSDMGVRHYVGRVKADRYDIALHYYVPEGATDNCLLIHGYFDHSALWRHYIHYWLQRQVGVFVFDLPGHGLSTGAEVSIDSFAEYQQVLREVIRTIGSLEIDQCIAMGQSTGGAILSDYILSCRKHSSQPFFSKAVLLAPLVRPCSWRSAKLAHSLLSPVVDYIQRDFSFNSNNPEFRHFIENRDPLQSNRLSAKWVGALRNWIPYFNQLPRSEIDLLLIQGERDATVDFPYNLRVLKEKFPSSELLMLPDAHHHLMGESADQRALITAAMDRFMMAGTD